jgi:hypothetical protein
MWICFPKIVLHSFSVNNTTGTKHKLDCRILGWLLVPLLDSRWFTSIATRYQNLWLRSMERNLLRSTAEDVMLILVSVSSLQLGAISSPHRASNIRMVGADKGPLVS